MCMDQDLAQLDRRQFSCQICWRLIFCLCVDTSGSKYHDYENHFFQTITPITRMLAHLLMLYRRYSKVNEAVVDSPEHRSLAREAASASVVMVQNTNDVLPLRAGAHKSVAVVGPFADCGSECYLHSYNGHPSYQVSYLSAVREVVAAQGGTVVVPTSPSVADAVAAAEQASLIVVRGYLSVSKQFCVCEHLPTPCPIFNLIVMFSKRCHRNHSCGTCNPLSTFQFRNVRIYTMMFTLTYTFIVCVRL